jgi:hypothetical protein
MASGALTYPQLEAVWMQGASGTQYATPQWAALMSAIALAESSGIPTNTNPNDNGGTQTSWGLWQISLGNHDAPSPNWADPVENAKLAVGKLQSQGLGAWGTYTSGLYKQFLQSGVAPGSLPSTTASNSVQNAQTTSVTGDIWQGFNTVTGGPLGLLFGITPTSQTNPLVGIDAMANDIEQMAKWISWLFQPSNWLRIGGFFVGIITLIGAGFMFKEAL